MLSRSDWVHIVEMCDGMVRIEMTEVQDVAIREELPMLAGRAVVRAKGGRMNMNPELMI